MSESTFKVIQDYCNESTEKGISLREYATRKLCVVFFLFVEFGDFNVPVKLEHILNLANERSNLIRQLVSLTVIHTEEEVDSHIDRINEIDVELKKLISE